MRAKIESAEVKGLKVGVYTNLFMALAGWAAFYLSNSEALLLDGNFSFVIALSTIIAIIIAKKKHDRTPVFPYGGYFVESFFVLFKGLLILGITIAALFQNIIKILDYLNGETLERLESGPILYYSILLTLLCFGLAMYFERKNKSIGYTSSILKVEARATRVDAYLSLVVGVALILTTLVPQGSRLDFLLYIGDAIIVILLSLFLVKIPLETIREGFIELGGGVLQETDTREHMEQVIREHTPASLKIARTYISKMGSSYLIVLYLLAENQTIDAHKIQTFRSDLKQNLGPKFPNLQVEVVLGE